MKTVIRSVYINNMSKVLVLSSCYLFYLAAAADIITI